MAILRKDIRVAFWATVALAAVGFAYVGVLLFAGGDDEAVTDASADDARLAAARVDPLDAWPAEPEPEPAPIPAPTPTLAAGTIEAWPDELEVTRTPSPQTGDPGVLPRGSTSLGVAEPSDIIDLPMPSLRPAVFATPVASIAPAEPEPADREPDRAARMHTIAAGDSFVTIAQQYYGDAGAFDVLAAANPDLDPRRLRIGQSVVVPALDAQREPIGLPKINADARTHTVRPGQTLSDIAAERLGRSNLWESVYDLNRDVIGDDPGNLSVGMVLRLPS